MSGYKVKRTTFVVKFSDPEHDGMEIRVRALSMEERLHAVFDLAWLPEDTPQERADKQRELHQIFIDHLVDWNLTEEEDDTPVPQTYKGLASLEPPFVGTIIGTWLSAVPAPLDKPSTGGELSPVESTLTDIPSESLAS